MCGAVLFSFSLQYALIIGYGGYIIQQLVINKKANGYLVASFVLLLFGSVAQLFA